MGRAMLRFWAGQEWTPWIWDGTTVAADPHPVRRRLDTSDLDHLKFIGTVFLPEAKAAGIVTPSDDAGLEALVDQLTAEATGVAIPAGVGGAPMATPLPIPAAPPTSTSAPMSSSAPTSHPGPTSRTAADLAWAQLWGVPTPPPGPASASTTTDGTVPTGATPTGVQAVQTAHRPALHPVQKSRQSAFGRWWARSREAVGSDVAVHGLAYLGVLLFFVGVFGLVVFAFGDVTPGLRPLAEFSIALAPFAAGAMLLRREAVIVGRALEVMGGLLLPVMVITTFLDDVAFPPDLDGVPLVLMLTGLIGLIAALYAWWSMKHPNSALRFLVAPMVWLTVAMATLGLGRAVPTGKAVATPAAAQVAAMAAALVVTVAWARSRPRASLAAPTLSSAGPGLLVVTLLTVLTWTAEGSPTVPVFSSGVLVLTALELLRDRLPVSVLGSAEPLWWALVWAALEQAVGTAPAGAAAAAGFVLIMEVAASARRPAWAVTIPAVGAAAALASTWSDPWWATAAFGAAALWALGRRLSPYAVPGAVVALDGAAAVLPAFALAALAVASNPATAVAAGTGVVLLATLPAMRPLLRRGPDDTFWVLWWRTAGTVVALGAGAVWTDTLAINQQWLVTISLVMLALASAVGPVPGVWRPWPVTVLSTAAWLTGCATVGASDLARAGTLAAAGLAMVALAHSARTSFRGDRAASLGLAGHALGTAAVVVATYGRWSLVVASALATAGWVLTTVMDVRTVSPVEQALRRAGAWVGWLPFGLAGVGLPVTVALALDAGDVLSISNPWAVVIPALTAVMYAAATRLPLPDRIGATAAWGGFSAGVLASLLAGERLPETLGLGALVVSVAVTARQRRAPVMTWVAWAGLAPLAGLLAADRWSWFGALPVETAAAVTLVTVGGALLVGGAAVDLRGRPWAPRYAPSHSSTLAPVIIGGAELLAALFTAYALLSREQTGWVMASAAGVIMATALLARAGALAGVSTILGRAAVVLLASPQIEARPWIPVAVALALLAIAQVLSATQTGAEWWARWDLPLLVAAAPVAVTALTAATVGDDWGRTFVAVGFECLGVAARLRRILMVLVPVGTIGTALVLAGTANMGEGWLAIALVALSAALTTLAASVHGSARRPLQIGGALAAVAAWSVATDWFGWSAQRSVDVTMVGAGMLAMSAALVARSNRLEHSWVLVWGGMAVAVAAFAWSTAPSWPVAAGLLIVALALLTGAEPLEQAWLRSLGMAFGLASLVVALQTGHTSVGTQVAVLAALSAACAVFSLSLWVRHRAATWQRPLLILGVAFAMGTIAVTAGSRSTDDLMLLVPGLAASALQAAAVGVVVRNAVAQMLSPVLACASWLVFSHEAMDANPQWITVPIGLAILSVAELWRQDRKAHGGRVTATEIVALELVGVAFLVGAAFVQAVTEAVAYAVLAALLGLAVTGWGVVTKVRRRVAVGALTVLASFVVLVAVPLVGLLPSFEGAGLWILIAAVGLGALLIASFLEQSKAAVRQGARRFGEITAGWE